VREHGQEVVHLAALQQVAVAEGGAPRARLKDDHCSAADGAGLLSVHQSQSNSLSATGQSADKGAAAQWRAPGAPFEVYQQYQQYLLTTPNGFSNLKSDILNRDHSRRPEPSSERACGWVSMSARSRHPTLPNHRACPCSCGPPQSHAHPKSKRA